MRGAVVRALLVVLAACGDDEAGVPDGGGDPRFDAPRAIDGPPSCTPGPTECTDCVDNDNDGAADGFDLECTAGYDDDESSLGDGIPDPADGDSRECAFDGNSGAGDDGCIRHNCCALGISDPAMCPFNGFDPATCDDPVATTCTTVCLPLTLPGCDCFGCCTVHDPATDTARDILLDVVIAPDCDADTLLDPQACVSCVKADDCAVPCGEDCVLCPGQTAADLPAACAGTPACPAGLDACSPTAPCAAGEFCANGCCVDTVD